MNQGIESLRQAIIRKLEEENNLKYDLNQILVSNGAKHSAYNTVNAVIGTGDEVIIPAPYWVSYSEMVQMAGGVPVFVVAPEESGFKITKEQLEEAITGKTKALILNNPCNPTGALYSRKELEGLAAVIEQKGIYVISDEIYEKLVYDDANYISIAAISKKMKEQTIVVNGVSKAYAMTGWRIGFAAGPEEIISSANKIQSHSTSNASSISQYAALAALEGPKNTLISMKSEFQKRRDYVLKRFKEIKHLHCLKPEGAFYVFPNISKFLEKHNASTTFSTSSDLAYHLLRDAKVATVPGSAFGMENFIRLSYTNSLDNIKKGLDRIVAILS
jgi:aspartate aminotransferase